MVQIIGAMCLLSGTVAEQLIRFASVRSCLTIHAWWTLTPRQVKINGPAPESQDMNN